MRHGQSGESIKDRRPGVPTCLNAARHALGAGGAGYLGMVTVMAVGEWTPSSCVLENYDTMHWKTSWNWGTRSEGLKVRDLKV